MKIKEKQKTKLQLRVESSQTTGKLVACFNASIKFLIIVAMAFCCSCSCQLHAALFAQPAEASHRVELLASRVESSVQSRRVFLKAVTG